MVLRIHYPSLVSKGEESVDKKFMFCTLLIFEDDVEVKNDYFSYYEDFTLISDKKAQMLIGSHQFPTQ